MSALVLDDQLDLEELLPGLTWIGWKRLQDLRPGQQILDDRVPALLLDLKQPTFVTIDHGFWGQEFCHRRYCILYFALSTGQQRELPNPLRRLFQTKEFRTRSARMGKVARIRRGTVTYWEDGEKKVIVLPESN